MTIKTGSYAEIEFPPTIGHDPLRLPKSLMEAARKAAAKDDTSMNQLFVSAVAERLSALETE